MIDSAFNQVVGFLSRHFELIMAINIAIFIYYIFILITLKLSDRSLRDYIRNILKSALYGSVFVVQMLLIALMGYLYWYNYHRPADYLHIPGDIIPHTFWVDSRQEIYFIDGEDLLLTQADGENKQFVYEGPSPIREYHFSPDGKHILLVTDQTLVLFDRDQGSAQEVDSIALQGPVDNLKGVISNIRWAPNGRQFCYEISRWSSVSSQDNVYIYDLEKRRKKAIQSPARRISHLYWDTQSENLYYLKHETEDTASINNVKVVRISLDTLEPQLVTEIPFDEARIPLINLELRDIDLFVKGDLLSYGDYSQKQQLVSVEGNHVGIDENDNFYFITEKWFRQRLFKVRRKPVVREGDINRYQYKGGELAVRNIRWLPDGRYVIMEHFDLGILILDPFKNRIGQLIEKRGRDFGWFIDIEHYEIPEPVVIPRESTGNNKKRSLSFVPR